MHQAHAADRTPPDEPSPGRPPPAEPPPATAFESFVLAIEPKLRRALIAAYGFDDGRDATAEALAYAWEHWDRLAGVKNLPGYLFRVGQTRTRRRRQPVIFAAPDNGERYRMPISIVTSAVTAAAVLVATGQLGGGQPETGNLVTTSVIRHMASATEAALATSGKVLITSRSHGLAEVIDQHGHRRHPVEISTGTYSFSGKDYNQTMHTKVPGQPPLPGVSIVRFVHGQEYFFASGFPCAPKHPHCDTSEPRWYHMVGRLTKYKGMADPRGILKVLAPSAKFVSEGSQTIDGVRTTKLRATKLSGLARGGALPNLSPKGQKLTGLTVWVDARDVVRQIHLSGRDGYISSRKSAHVTYPTSLRFTMTADFLDIGIRQHIVAPRHAIKYVSK